MVCLDQCAEEARGIRSCQERFMLIEMRSHRAGRLAGIVRNALLDFDPQKEIDGRTWWIEKTVQHSPRPTRYVA